MRLVDEVYASGFCRLWLSEWVYLFVLSVLLSLPMKSLD